MHKTRTSKATNATQAIIIGGGPAGLATALRLHKHNNITCVVYELRDEPTTLGGAVGILSNGLRLFDRLGVYDALCAKGYAGGRLTVHSVQGGVVGSRDYVGWARDKTGYGYLRIKRVDLVDVLLEAVKREGIEVRFGVRVTGVEEVGGGAVVRTSEGSERADLVLGCDGIHSFVRREVVDPGFVGVYSGFAGSFSIIPADVLPAEAVDMMSGLHAMMTEEGMVMVNPCTANKDEVMWGFSREVKLPEGGDGRDGWEETRKAEVEGFKDYMLKLLDNTRGEWGGIVKNIVSKTAVIKFHPVYSLPLGGRWYKGRCLLLGDAAHAMSPHAGQGVSMAIEDTFLLSRLLENPNRPLAEVFAKFDEIRRPRVNEIYTLAAKNADNRKKTGPLGLWMKEAAFGMYMSVSSALGLDQWGFGQKHLVYDIDEVEL
jgi:2-polyprenyl-6-methoxyphenol hydroxylase-like FAD-dependent oxidoreductase